MVSKCWTGAAHALFCGETISIENLHRIQSLEFSANFQRFNLNANTCDLSTTVSQGPVAGSPRRKQRDGRGREMFFLLRNSPGSRQGLELLPREKTPDSAKIPQLGQEEAVVAPPPPQLDMGKFCKRQPAACEVGG